MTELVSLSLISLEYVALKMLSCTFASDIAKDCIII